MGFRTSTIEYDYQNENGETRHFQGSIEYPDGLSVSAIVEYAEEGGFKGETKIKILRDKIVLDGTNVKNLLQ
jgi:hypothetical protein